MSNAPGQTHSSARGGVSHAQRQGRNGSTRLGSFLHNAISSLYKRSASRDLADVPRLILLVCAGLTVFGVIMVLSASSVSMISQGMSPFSQVTRQVMFAALGAAALGAIAVLKVQRYRKMWVVNILLALAILAQIAVLAIGTDINGNRNWIRFSGIQIQPSEFSKLAIVLWMAMVLTRQGSKLKEKTSRAIFPALFGLLPLMLLILAGKDLGTVIVYAFIFLGMVYIAGANRKTMVWLSIILIVSAIVGSISSSNRRERLMSVLGVCTGSVCDQSQAGGVALATGGFWGVGLGQSRQKYNYLPEAHNDYIFAIIGEELGLLGTLTVVLLYLGLIYCALRIIARTADPFIRIATGGIIAWLSTQAIVNMAMVSGILPVIGVPLPFISYGGSSLISSMLAAGMLYAFARQTPLVGGPIPAADLTKQTPREVRRANEDWKRRLSLQAIVEDERLQLQEAGGSLGKDYWGEGLLRRVKELPSWLGITQRQREHTRKTYEQRAQARADRAAERRRKAEHQEALAHEEQRIQRERQRLREQRFQEEHPNGLHTHERVPQLRRKGDVQPTSRPSQGRQRSTPADHEDTIPLQNLQKRTNANRARHRSSSSGRLPAGLRPLHPQPGSQTSSSEKPSAGASRQIRRQQPSQSQQNPRGRKPGQGGSRS